MLKSAFTLFLTLPLLFAGLNMCSSQAATDRVTTARKNVQEEFGAHFGKPVFIRIIKDDRDLELWVQEADKSWRILKH